MAMKGVTKRPEGLRRKGIVFLAAGARLRTWNISTTSSLSWYCGNLVVVVSALPVDGRQLVTTTRDPGGVGAATVVPIARS
jgi:hypothetical protein